MKTEAIKALREREWTMGNGQCEICHGLDTHWYETGQEWEASAIGHEKGCAVSLALQVLGESPIIKGEWEPGYEAPVTEFRVMMAIDCQRTFESPAFVSLQKRYGKPVPSPEEIQAGRAEVEALKTRHAQKSSAPVDERQSQH